MITRKTHIWDKFTGWTDEGLRIAVKNKIQSDGKDE